MNNRFFILQLNIYSPSISPVIYQFCVKVFIYKITKSYRHTNLISVSFKWYFTWTWILIISPDFISELLYFFWSLSIENWIPLKPVLGGHERCCTFHYLSWTDLIKPSIQFSFLDFALVPLEGYTFTRLWSRKVTCFLCVKCCILIGKLLFDGQH